VTVVKARRQAKILELIRHAVIETQEELAEALGKQGIPVTQATVSRDIKELQLTKVPTGDGRYRYAIPEEAPPSSWEKRRRIFQDSVLTLDLSENLIIIKALPGTAPGVASAIDHLNWPEMIGSVAGDDTVLMVIKPKERTEEVVERIRSLMR
jgi:transcriptional regulator of arginine metabolism